MGKSTDNSAGPDEGHLERTMEILDEDHLEFEEILLNLQARAEQLSTQVKQLSDKITESRTETLETREMIEILDMKVDRLLALVTGWRREHIE
jgi:uncharacterized protein YlxW (UPF0749 family)